MEDNPFTPIVDGRITDIRFSVATHDEICTSSISEGPINHASQLTNPFLGLPLQSGKCESCATSEPGKCEGHFGYIQLPIPIYHPCHVSELKKLLSLVCLNCLRLKRGKNVGSDKSANTPCLYCTEFPQILVKEDKTTDGVVLLELKLARRSEPPCGFWNFLDRFGYRYGEGKSRILLPCEALEVLKRLTEDTRKKLSNKGCFPQDGYILQKLPVPPNCLSIPDISDGVSIMSSDISVSMLRKVLKQADIIKSSRSGRPNFESHKVEVNDLQLAVAQYLRARGTAKDSRDIKMRAGTSKEVDDSATKAWLEKMRTFFISKGSGYCSRSVITGDAYKRVNEIGLPFEVAQRITFEEKVTEGNRVHLQELVDDKLCLTYRDGGSVYSLREGSKGHTLLKVGQVVHRRIMDGDVVFINRPPSTHKHSLQALSVYIHEDHTVKINPLICGPLDADFDGDCVHLFYPQSLAARAEVLELFSVEQQLLSSHTGTLNLQLKNDSLLSLKIMFRRFFLDKVTAQQLAMFLPSSLEGPALLKADLVESQWTVLQILQAALPDHFDCTGERYLISQREILKLDFNRDILQSMSNEIISSVLSKIGSKEALNVFDSLQPLLMENLFSEGYSVSLKDYYIPKSVLEDISRNIQEVSPLLHHLRSTYNELVEMQIGNHLRSVKAPIVNFILKFSGLGNLIDSKSESSINKVVEQIGFLGLQLADRGKFYSRNLVEDMNSLFLRKYAVNGVESEAFGLIKSCIFHGLNPYEDLVHSISSREVLVRSSRGLTEPGTLFKNLMTILRDVVICYDGTVRNVCSDTIIQFEYRMEGGMDSHKTYPAGEAVGALAATAISNPAYKAVLDSSSSSNASWDLMKEILVCKVNFVNDLNDRRVILYLNDCVCPKRHCKENAAYLVQNQLKRVSLRDISVNFSIEYQNQQDSPDSAVTNTSLVGHIHLDKKRLKDLGRSMHEVLLKCQETVGLFRRRKKSKLVDFLKNTFLSVSECCCFQQPYESDWGQIPCLQFSWRLDVSGPLLETTSQIMANMISPILLDTIIKGDRRVCKANIIWVSPDTTTWVKSNCRTQRGELALEIVLEKEVIKKHGDAWRHALDSCLPVIHLIDTTRSVPYAIRQVQELLGISCAFDQAVQRLSTSIRMVNKGVLKEHLILAANCMTCTGSLIGFNKGGYKALFRSLNVQIPFTEATLFTPRKCFERAAEKCHTDTLSGIVASCSWGKHVAVGSGARFEILWNKKEHGSDQNGVIDVYSFLQLVRTSSNGGESNTSCLGEDYDDLEIENRVAESPEHNFDYSKPTFDDAELQNNFEEHETDEKGNSSKSNWERDLSVVKSSGKSEWKADQHGDVEKAISWSRPDESTGWGEQTVKTNMNSWETSGWGATADKEPSEGGPAAGWNTVESQKLPSEKPREQTAKMDMNSWEPSGWGTTADKEPSEGGPAAGWNSVESQKLPSEKPLDAWGKEPTKTDARGKEPSGWGATADKGPSDGDPAAGWNTAESQKLPADNPVVMWGKEPTKADTWGKEPSAWGATVDNKPSEGGPAAGWNTAKSQKLPSQKPDDAWGKEPTKADTSDWDKQISGLGAIEDKEPSVGWNSMKSQKQPPQTTHRDGWESRAEVQWDQSEKSNEGQYKRPRVDSPRSVDWNTSNSQTTSQTEPRDTWGKKPEDRKSSGWSQNETAIQSINSLGWDYPGATSWKKNGQTQNENGKESNRDAWGKSEKVTQPTSPLGCETWGKNAEETSSRGWGQGTPEKQPTSSHAWDSPSVTAWTKNGQTQNEQERESPCDTWGQNSSLGLDSPCSTGWTRSQDEQETNLPWGRGKKASGGRGWGSSNSGDWKQKTRPAKAPGGRGDWNARGTATPSRLKMDQYTTEEQTICLEMDKITTSIKKIMHESGYNDGDPLSADDQSHVLDSVFNYHPDKAAKMGSGIDYVTIDKHKIYQETRCFYIVSSDGRKEDFSYLKCLENLVKDKYPEMAVSFIGKYFNRKSARSQGGDGQGVTPASQQ